MSYNRIEMKWSVHSVRKEEQERLAQEEWRTIEKEE